MWVLINNNNDNNNNNQNTSSNNSNNNNSNDIFDVYRTNYNQTLLQQQHSYPNYTTQPLLHCQQDIIHSTSTHSTTFDSNSKSKFPIEPNDDNFNRSTGSSSFAIRNVVDTTDVTNIQSVCQSHEIETDVQSTQALKTIHPNATRNDDCEEVGKTFITFGKQTSV